MEKELLAQGENLMRICNSCRYCEGFCAVWRAMEYRREFPPGDLNYLANLCHDCSECYYACQYAPPHEWDINPPLTFARIRTRSYEQYAWPGVLARAFRTNGLVVALVTALACVLFQFGVVIVHGMASLSTPVPGGDFYQVASHGALVAAFGLAGLFSAAALAIGLVRFCRDIGEKPSDLFSPTNLEVTLKETLRLDYLDGGGFGCTYPGEDSSPLRRWFHHFTFYGFLLCFASTTVAAICDYVFQWPAPYGYLSLPVILGFLGGLGLLVGPAGLLALKRRRNRDITNEGQVGMDTAFLVLLLLASASGLLLLILRQGSAMGTLLVVHLGIVMGVFLTMPFSKFVHGLYRFAAIAKFALERKRKQVLGA
jgi:citrate/tricarballylate utilization protein